MKLFLSWSGAPSLKMAEALQDFLPNVLEGLKVFLSSESIRKGADWLRVIREQLDTTDFGILCLTNEALASDWLIFEAGAIAKKVEHAGVVPVLLGIANADVTGPLSKFQGMPPTKDELWKLVNEMNQLAGESQLTSEKLRKRFDKWWPELEASIAEVLKLIGTARTPAPARKLEDMVAETLDLVRSLASGGLGPLTLAEILRQPGMLGGIAVMSPGASGVLTDVADAKDKARIAALAQALRDKKDPQPAPGRHSRIERAIDTDDLPVDPGAKE